MININLLPEAIRRKERMPIPRLLAVLGALTAFLLLILVNLQYGMNIIPELENRRQSLQDTRGMLQAEADRLKQINAEIARFTEHVDAVKTLYRQRIVWSKILADLKSIVNFDSAMSEYNQDMRYIWLGTLSGKGNELSMTGFATDSGQVVAMRMPERLLRGFLSYAPAALPEEDEEERLQAALKDAQAAHDTLRRDNPELPLQGRAELDIRERLGEIQNIKSGGIALKPFPELIVPPSLRLVNATWSNAPQPRQRAAGLEEVFPAQAWSFSISMQLR